MNKKFLIALSALLMTCTAVAQPAKTFTRADTLRGSIGPERAWWDVQYYDLTIRPDIARKTVQGTNIISYKVVSDHQPGSMQIDLMEPLKIDEVILENRQLSFQREGNVYHVQVPRQQLHSLHSLTIHFSGTPRIAPRAPWDGGWTFTTDSLGRPWLTVTCQGLGASVWYPNKDHQSDEPDEGASLTMIVPDSLVGVSNGRLQSVKENEDHTVSYKWHVVSPINNYNLIPYIGKYVHFEETYSGGKGKLDIGYWVLDYNLEKAKAYLPAEVHHMLKSFEYWFGPYPFYEDGYKLVDVPHTGMEHQSAVAYGNRYKPGYRGRDGSGTGWGMKWDFIVVHESGHEWFGNNLTTKDLADMWVHEGFANYSETLFVDYIFGAQAANEYNYGTRRGIRNDRPVIATYGVNDQGSGDMYPKGGNLLHTLRHSMDNDQLFRSILRGLNKDFYHQTVTSAQVEKYISQKAGFDYSKVFDQYLRTTQIPRLEYYMDGNTVYYRWANCIEGFDLPLVLKNDHAKMRIQPSAQWQHTSLQKEQLPLFAKDAIGFMYYVEVEETAKR